MTKILVTGYIVRYPLGGLTWHYLQYILGLTRLGHDVYFLESAEYPKACYDAELDIMTNNCSYGLKYLKNIITHFNLSNKWVFIDYDKNYYGLDKKKTIDLMRKGIRLWKNYINELCDEVKSLLEDKYNNQIDEKEFARKFKWRQREIICALINKMQIEKIVN